MNTALEFLAFVGSAAIGLIIVLVGVKLFGFVKDKIEYRAKKHRDKHRFDCPPTGKCYCVQCNYWHAQETDRTSGVCTVWEKLTADSETCARGYLRTEQEYKNEKWRLEVLNEVCKYRVSKEGENQDV